MKDMNLTIPRNLTLKGLAFALAALLWVHVVTDKYYEVEVTLPVTLVSLADDVALAEAPPDSLMVAITATGKDLLRRAWRKAGFALRLNEQRLGRRDVSLDASNVSLVSGEGISFAGIVTPRTHRFDFDRREQIEVDVLSRVTVIPADGFAVSQEQKVTPSRVTAIGPRGSLERLRTAYTEARTLQDVRSDFDLTLDLESNGIYGVTFDPPVAQYRVSVTALKERLIDSLPIAALNAPRGGLELNPRFISVLISGGADLIDELEAHQVSVTIDYQNRLPDNTAKIIVSLPLHVELISLSDSLTLIK